MTDEKLRAAIETLCDKWEDGVSPECSEAADEFRALLANDDAAALRKRDEQKWDECYEKAAQWWRGGDVDQPAPVNPYRDTAAEVDDA